MGKKIGLSCELSINTGTYAIPVWSAIDNARDVTLSMSKSEADATTRGSNGWRETIMAIKDGSIEFDLAHDYSDANYVLLNNAWFADTSVDIIALDGLNATAGSHGVRMICAVQDITRNEPLEDLVTASIVLKPTPNTDTTPLEFTAA